LEEPVLVEYFENISLYQKDRSREYILHEKDIIDFAKKWTPQPFHMDPEYAKTTRIGSLFAAGAHLFAICAKLSAERTPRLATIAGMGIDEMRFLNPGRPGDIFVLEREVVSKRESKSDPNAGIVRYAMHLLNQREEPVLTYKIDMLVEKRPTH
jgi:acyl dehydratase